MTIYELTQAIARYKRAVLIGLGVILLLVLGLMFTYEDGGIGWRGGLKYESAFEISVVDPGTLTISHSDPEIGLDIAAQEYAQLLSSAEAAEVVGYLSGYELEETIDANSSSGSSIISGSVIGPTPDLARAAAQNSFVWLAQKIQKPLNPQPVVPTTIPSIPDVNLASAFSSTIAVDVDASLTDVSPDLFVLVDSGHDRSVVVPVAQRAGDSVNAKATLEAGGSLILRLETSDGTLVDTLRIAPGPLPSSAKAYPSLDVNLGPESLILVPEPVDDEDSSPSTIWAFDAQAISTEWIDGVPVAVSDQGETSSRQLQVAMLTDIPSTIQIGGRRAPLIGFTVLMVGVIALLTGVIIADTWRRSRDDAVGSTGGTTSGVGVSDTSSDDVAGRSVQEKGAGKPETLPRPPESPPSDQ